MSSSIPTCVACKYRHRKCPPDCIFAPFFSSDQPEKFQYVNRVFGASNVAKLLAPLNVSQRQAAVDSLAFEAEALVHYPPYGCIGFLKLLQHKLRFLTDELTRAKNELAMLMGQPNEIAFLPASGEAAAAAAFMQQPPQNLEHLMANLSISAVAPQYGAAFPMIVPFQAPVPDAPLMIREPQPAGAGAVVQQQQQNVMTEQQMIDAQMAMLLSRNEQEEETYRAFEQQQYRHHEQLQQGHSLGDNRFDGKSQNQIEFGSGSGSGSGSVSDVGSYSVSPYLAMGNFSGGYQDDAQQDESHPDYQHIVTDPQPQEYQLLVQEHQEPKHRLSNNNRFEGAGSSSSMAALPGGNSQNPIEFGLGLLSGLDLELDSSSVSPYLDLENYGVGYQDEPQQSESHPDNKQIVTDPQPQLSLQQHQFQVQEHQEQNQNLAVQTEENKDPGSGAELDFNMFLIDEELLWSLMAEKEN